jgi:hypothetical protein
VEIEEIALWDAEAGRSSIPKSFQSTRKTKFRRGSRRNAYIRRAHGSTSEVRT